MRSAFVWRITQRIAQFFTDVSGQPIGPILEGQGSFLDSWLYAA